MQTASQHRWWVTPCCWPTLIPRAFSNCYFIICFSINPNFFSLHMWPILHENQNRKLCSAIFFVENRTITSLSTLLIICYICSKPLAHHKTLLYKILNKSTFLTIKVFEVGVVNGNKKMNDFGQCLSNFFLHFMLFLNFLKISKIFYTKRYNMT